MGKHRVDIAVFVAGIALALFVLSATVPAQVVPVDDDPVVVATTTTFHPHADAIATIEAVGGTRRAILYLHAACWPEQYEDRPTHGRPEMLDRLTCPIPPDQIPHPGPSAADILGD